MSKTPIILACESSCDDTSIAVLTLDGTIVQHKLRINSKISKDTLGIVPERQARAHLQNYTDHFDSLIKEFPDISSNLVATTATIGPGLVGGLMVGATFAKSIAWNLNIPFFAQNHLVGHILSPRFQKNKPNYPYLTFLASGGHTQIVYVKSPFDFHVLGSTRDDALGEAFDKTAVLLGLGFPGGELIEALAKKGDPKAFSLPRPMLGHNSLEFSFSGLKSAVRRICDEKNNIQVSSNTVYPDNWEANLAASFQQATIDCVVDRLNRSLKYVFKSKAIANPSAISVAGGVMRNKALRQELLQLSKKWSLEIYFPQPWLCTDNAVMIAWATLEQNNFLAINNSCVSNKEFSASVKPRWSLNSI